LATHRQQALDALRKRQYAKGQVHALLALEAATRDVAKATREQTRKMIELWNVEPR
jgi:hypothetical protein